MPVVYVHVHVPKNGGQTFNSVLKRRFGQEYERAYSDQPGYIFSDAEKRDFMHQHPACRCISGHTFRYPGPELPEVEYRYLAFLRHPVERLVSLYAYEQQHSPETHSSHRPIEEWIEARLAEDNALQNYQAFHILGTRDPQAVNFEQARQVLDSFFFVGILELYDQSLLLLADKMGSPLHSLKYQKRNVSNSRSRFPIDDRTRRRLLELNEVDLRLYEHARRKVERELERLNPAQLRADLAQFRAMREPTPSPEPRHVRFARRLRGLARRMRLVH